MDKANDFNASLIQHVILRLGENGIDTKNPGGLVEEFENTADSFYCKYLDIFLWNYYGNRIGTALIFNWFREERGERIRFD